MGIVINEITATLAEQIKRHAVVVWFDPECVYAPVMEKLDLPGVTIQRYDAQTGFLQLRRDIEPLWSSPTASSGTRPKVLIYVPLSSADSHDALVEYIVAGVQLEPGIHPPERNTRLAVVAKRALEKVLPPASVEKVVKDIEKGSLSLKEIEDIAEKGLEVQTGALAVIFQTSNPEEIALRFLTDADVDKDLLEKSAGGGLADLLGNAFGFHPTSTDLPGLRALLARHILLVEFLNALGKAVPASLKTIPVPDNKGARESAVRVAQTWRLRRDLAESYIKAAQKLEAELGIGGIDWTIEGLSKSETFCRAEQALQALVEKQYLTSPKAAAGLTSIVQQRLQGFWASQQPAVKIHWQVILEAGEILVLAEKVAQALKSNLTASALFKKYTVEESPWCELDTYHRHLERDYNTFDVDANDHDSLVKLVSAAQSRYAETVQELALRFVKAYEGIGFVLPGTQQQNRVYVDFVDPQVKKGKTAYLLVDAFRYEMARELCSQLPEEWQHSLIPAAATPPTITEVGMAALMPGAEKGMALVPAGPGKLAVKLDGSTLKNRPDRVTHISAKGMGPVAVCLLSEIAPLKDKHLRTKLTNARLLVITATEEIDGLWENQPTMARQLQDHAFDQLRRGIRALFGLGVQQVIVTADHGFLSGSSLVMGEPVHAPGGDEADLHRRVWLGKGGAAIPNSLRKPISAFGLGGDLELVTPYGLAVFKAPGGSLEYFHGGLSLQEIVIPVLTIASGASPVDTDKPPFQWEAEIGSQQITTRFFSVTVKGSAENLLAQPPRIRVEIRAGDQVISQPVAASYGYNEATRDVSMEYETSAPGSLKANTITLQVTEIPNIDKVDLHLLDEIGATLLKVAGIPLDIAF